MHINMGRGKTADTKDILMERAMVQPVVTMVEPMQKATVEASHGAVPATAVATLMETQEAKAGGNFNGALGGGGEN